MSNEQRIKFRDACMKRAGIKRVPNFIAKFKKGCSVGSRHYVKV